MDAREYDTLADTCLRRVASWLEAFDPDELDFSESDGIVTFEFADGTRYVLNRQAAAQQMWFAANAEAWHYEWNAEADAWQDDRDAHALTSRLATAVSTKLGCHVEFDA